MSPDWQAGEAENPQVPDNIRHLGKVGARFLVHQGQFSKQAVWRDSGGAWETLLETSGHVTKNTFTLQGNPWPFLLQEDSHSVKGRNLIISYQSLQDTVSLDLKDIFFNISPSCSQS